MTNDTPRCLGYNGPCPHLDDGVCKIARCVNGPVEVVKYVADLERQLSLAQTENAGHIRIEDELKLDLAQAQARIETLLKKVHQ